MATIEDLKARRTWVAWRAEPGPGGKPTKVPYNPQTGCKASTTRPADWLTYAEAQACAGAFDGLGIVLADGLCGCDIDHVISADGEVEGRGRWAMAALDSYTEYSPSGTGLHILCFATLPPGRRKNTDLGIELYGPGSPRFLTFTGNVVPGARATVEAREEEFNALHSELFPEGEPRPQAAATVPADLTASDDELLRAAFAAANGEAIRTLFDEAGADGNSEGDASLCGLLAFYSGGDAARLERLMRRSARVRPKWDTRRGSETYIGRECRLAIERHAGDWYKPKRRKPFLHEEAAVAATPIAQTDTQARLLEQALPTQGWLADYVGWARPCTESPTLFHLACGLGCLAATVGRRAWIPQPPGQLYCNLFIALIGGQGVVRKSTALGFADRVLDQAFPDFIFSGDATAEALCTKVLIDTPERLLMPDELARTLGGPDYMAAVKPLLAELFNCPRELRRSRSGQGSGTVEEPTISILGASTLSWLRGAVKGHDVGGGLLSRFLWFLAESEGRILPIPPVPDETRRCQLVRDLQALRASLGEGRQFDTEPMRDSYTGLYVKYRQMAEEEDEEGIGGFLIRLVSTHAPKLAMLYALAEDRKAAAVTAQHIERVGALLEILRRGMYQVVERVAETPLDILRERIFGIIVRKPGIKHGELLRAAHTDADQFSRCINTLLEAGRVRTTQGPRGGAQYWPPDVELVA